MRTGTRPRLALTFARDDAIASGVGGSAAALMLNSLITENHVGSDGLSDARRRLLDTRAARITPIKIKNNDTSRKPKELRQWPMLH